MVQRLLRRLLDDTPADERPLTREEMLAFFQAVRPEDLDLTEYRLFNDCGRYARNQVHECEQFELVVICWTSGQESDVHDHGESHCLYRVLEGTMTEQRYDAVGDGKARATTSCTYSPGDVTVASGEVLHRIANVGEEALVTLHFYSPPMQGANKTYDVVEDQEVRGA